MSSLVNEYLSNNNYYAAITECIKDNNYNFGLLLSKIILDKETDTTTVSYKKIQNVYLIYSLKTPIYNYYLTLVK